MESLPQRVMTVQVAKGDQDHIIPMILEWEGQQAHMGMVLRCTAMYDHCTLHGQRLVDT